MRKIRIAVGALLVAGGSMLFSSCIGSFSLTKSVLNWNKNVGSKVVNELIFFAFWLVPVYEVTSVADLLILNSIEFWSGKNVIQAHITNEIDTEQGKYVVVCDGRGYQITHEPTGRSFRLHFDEEIQTWSLVTTNEEYKLLTFVDDNHVRMIAPGGEFRRVELSEAGLTAYSEMIREATVSGALMASK